MKVLSDSSCFHGQMKPPLIKIFQSAINRKTKLQQINRVDFFLFIIYNVTQRNRPRNKGTIDCVWNKNISWWHFDIRH